MRGYGRWMAVAGVLAAGVVAGSPVAAAAPGDPGKQPDGSISPAGSNDWGCAPSRAHPRPVVLVHGTWDNQNAWDVLAPQLRASGYCVFSLNYGRDTSSVLGAVPGMYATGDIRASARELGGFVDRVRAATGAQRVDLIGHSQGAVMIRQYLRFAGGAAAVGTVVSLAGTNHGTSKGPLLDAVLRDDVTGPVAEATMARAVGMAAVQQMTGSEFLRTLNAGGDTDPGISYTVIASLVDDASKPPQATFLQAGPGATVDNVLVQDLCPADAYLHADLPKSPTVAFIVQRALDPAYAGNPCPS